MRSRPTFTFSAASRALTLFSALLFAGCTTLDESTPAQAIARAAASPNGVETTVRMLVRNVNAGVGAETGGFYLNSEPDYRDPRSVNVIVSARAAAALAAGGVTDPATTYLNREVLVRGVVRKRAIYFVDAKGRRTDDFYHQTQIAVFDPAQIVLLDSGRSPSPPATIDIARARTEDYLASEPSNPIRALYIERLQKRIRPSTRPSYSPPVSARASVPRPRSFASRSWCCPTVASPPTVKKSARNSGTIPTSP